MSVRDSFVERFSEADASILTEACVHHQKDRSNIIDVIFGDATADHANDNWGSEPFRYVVLCVIGFECVTKEYYRRFHRIDIDPEDFYEWVEQHAGLDEFDGDTPDNIVTLIGHFGGNGPLQLLRDFIDKEKVQ